MMRAHQPLAARPASGSLLSLVTLFPIYWLFVISVKPASTSSPRPSVILDSVYWKNYVEVLHDETLRRYMMNSLIVSTGNAVLVTVLAFMACYALSRFDLAGKENIFFWTITNRMAPAAVFLLPLLPALHQGLRDRRLQALRHPDRPDPALLHLQPAVRDLDARAARSTASRRSSTRRRPSTAPRPGRIREVVWPLARPGLAVTFILTWVFAWNEFLLAATLTSFNARTITTGLVGIRDHDRHRTGARWRRLDLHADPRALIFSMVQRHIVAGLTFGAVKE